MTPTMTSGIGPWEPPGNRPHPKSETCLDCKTNPFPMADNKHPANAGAENNVPNDSGGNSGEGGAELNANFNDLITDGKNAKTLLCERCGSKMLLPGAAQHVKKEIYLPYMRKKSEQQKATDGEILRDFWLVTDMYTFENIGFTKTVEGTVKYLICADCEIGPVGWHDITDKTKYFVALERVKHE